MINFDAAMTQEEMEEVEAPYQVVKPEIAPVNYKALVAQAQRDFDAYRPEFEEMIRKAKDHRVYDDVSAGEAVEMGASAQGLKRRLEKNRDFIIEEPNSFVAQVRGMVRFFTDSLSEAMASLGGKRDAWLREERIKAEKLRQQAEAEAKELQDRLNREARERAEQEAKERNVPVEDVKVEVAEVAPVILPTPIIEQPATTVRAASGAGTAYQRQGRLTYRILDMSKVPAEFLLVNGPLVNIKIKGGARGLDIPGLEIYEEAPKTMFKSR